MVFRHARKSDAEVILGIYNAVRGKGFCIWNDEYPFMPEIEADLQSEGLFVLEADNEIIGAASIVPQNEMDSVSVWTHRDAAEIARIVIAPEFQGRGYSEIIVSHLLSELKNRNVKYVHLAVERNQIPAQKTYKKLGFTTVGKWESYGHHYFLCEKEL